MLVYEMREQLDGRPAVDLVQHPSQRGLAGRLGIDHWIIDVGLSLSAPMGDVAFQLERSNHARHTRVGEIGVDSVTHLGDSSFAAIPQDTHDVQFALGEMEAGQ